MDTKDLLNYIEFVAPLNYAEEWDQSGIQIAGKKEEIKRLAIALDATLLTISQSLAWDADFILTHHPLTLAPQLPKTKDDYHTILKEILNSGAWLYSAHTSLDVQKNGPVCWLAEALKMDQLLPIQSLYTKPLLQVQFPLKDLSPDLFQDLTKLFAELDQFQDFRLSKGYFLCDPNFAPVVFNLFKRYRLQECLKIQPISSVNEQCGYGIIGDIMPTLDSNTFLNTLGQYLETDHISCVGEWPQTISRLAYCPGSGMNLARKAFSMGADIFISGDLKYHQAQEIEPLGLTIDAGHYSLEENMMKTWAGQIEDYFQGKDMEVRFFKGQNPFKVHELK